MRSIRLHFVNRSISLHLVQNYPSCLRRSSLSDSVGGAEDNKTKSPNPYTAMQITTSIDTVPPNVPPPLSGCYIDPNRTQSSRRRSPATHELLHRTYACLRSRQGSSYLWSSAITLSRHQAKITRGHPRGRNGFVIHRRDTPTNAVGQLATMRIAHTKAHCKFIQYPYPRANWWNPPVRVPRVLESSHENHVQNQQGNARALLRA